VGATPANGPAISAVILYANRHSLWNLPVRKAGLDLQVVDAAFHADTIVPGHGPLVDRNFAVAQLADLTDLATRLRALHRSKATQHQAFAAIEAVPSLRVDGLGWAVARAYSSLAGWPAQNEPMPASE